MTVSVHASQPHHSIDWTTPHGDRQHPTLSHHSSGVRFAWRLCVSDRQRRPAAYVERQDRSACDGARSLSWPASYVVEGSSAWRGTQRASADGYWLFRRLTRGLTCGGNGSYGIPSTFHLSDAIPSRTLLCLQVRSAASATMRNHKEGLRSQGDSQGSDRTHGLSSFYGVASCIRSLVGLCSFPLRRSARGELWRWI